MRRCAIAIFIELVTDPFTDVFASQVGARQGSGNGRAARAGKPSARRPVRGIEIKEDTYAYMKVVMSNGTELPLLDSGSSTGESSDGYTNFILQQVQEARMEKHQIVETFGDTYVFFFGESPRFLDCTATLLNTMDFNWRAEWWHNYENYLRGTKLVELGARCYLSWDDNIIEGYMLNAVASEGSDQPYSIALQFKFFVTNYHNVSLVDVDQYPVHSGAVVADSAALSFMRSSVSDNTDEYVGSTDDGPYNSFLQDTNDIASGTIPESSAAEDVQETDSLENDVIGVLESIGANADNDRALRDLGLGPNFSNGYRANQNAASGNGAGMGASTSFGSATGTSVSFGAMSGISMGVSASASAGMYADTAGSAYSAGSSGYTTQDPLGNVYGRAETQEQSFQPNSRQYVEGAGDHDYGYRSAYGGAGYGKAGYGDFGGTGFGGCSANGDPGYLDPELFSYNGVSSNQSAFDGWVRPRNDQTAVTRGPLLGGTSVMGAASISVTGRQSAFAFVALEGTLAEWVVAESETVYAHDVGASAASRLSDSIVSTLGSFGASVGGRTTL